MIRKCLANIFWSRKYRTLKKRKDFLFLIPSRLSLKEMKKYNFVQNQVFFLDRTLLCLMNHWLLLGKIACCKILCRFHFFVYCGKIFFTYLCKVEKLFSANYSSYLFKLHLTFSYPIGSHISLQSGNCSLVIHGIYRWQQMCLNSWL